MAQVIHARQQGSEHARLLTTLQPRFRRNRRRSPAPADERVRSPGRSLAGRERDFERSSTDSDPDPGRIFGEPAARRRPTLGKLNAIGWPI